MKGTLPSQWDGGWQQAQLGGTTPSSACVRGIWRPVWPRAQALLPWTDPETSQGPCPNSAFQVLPTVKQTPRKGQRHAWLNTREQGCTCITHPYQRSPC